MLSRNPAFQAAYSDLSCLTVASVENQQTLIEDAPSCQRTIRTNVDVDENPGIYNINICERMDSMRMQVRVILCKQSLVISSTVNIKQHGVQTENYSSMQRTLSALDGAK